MGNNTEIDPDPKSPWRQRILLVGLTVIIVTMFKLCGLATA